MGFLGNLFGGDHEASDAIKESNRIYQEYAQKAQDELRKQQAQGRTDITGYAKPYVEAGRTGLDAYMASLGLGPEGGRGQTRAVDRFRMSPGYQFALRQGLDAVRSRGAAGGMIGSGAEARELQRYGQGLAAQEYGRYQQRLTGLASMGQQTSMRTGLGLAQLGLGYGGDIANIYGSMGRASAASAMEAARARSAERRGIFGELGGIAGAAIGAYYGGPQGAMMGGQIGKGLGGVAAGGEGWQALGGQKQQQQGGGGMGGMPGLSSLGGMFGKSYSPAQGTAATSMWGTDVWEDPDTGRLVPIGR